MSARTDILDALQRDGYKHREAASLLEVATKEPQTPTGLGDPEFPATLSGGHALIIEYGDEELMAWCQCGRPLGTGRPSQPLDPFAEAWERHVMAGVSR
ncbi:hypothetical protein [Streptomyces sp. L2]|uniref:hypothetical protein n=1 Tax=Streptomyces sp. L2 TaxID=2162665 RepID=UPI00101243FB|nr:hypothetical protein [Streptomyces sp. L2]